GGPCQRDRGNVSRQETRKSSGAGQLGFLPIAKFLRWNGQLPGDGRGDSLDRDVSSDQALVRSSFEHAFGEVSLSHDRLKVPRKGFVGAREVCHRIEKGL